jgi:stress response protein YsnF
MNNTFKENGDPKDNKDNQQSYNDTLSTSSDMQGEQIVSQIPLYCEDFELTKKEVETNIQLEKTWVHTTKKIEIPLKYEEILLNGKEFGSYDQKEIVEMLSKIKDKISHVFHHDEEHKKNNNVDSPPDKKSDKQLQQHDNRDPSHENRELEIHYTKQSSKKENVDSSSTPSVSPNGNNTNQFEKVIPLWGEEITINRKLVKMGEIIIRKYQVSENHDIQVELNKEKYSIKYPDGFDINEKKYKTLT